jgi:hypothetical protein
MRGRPLTDDEYKVVSLPPIETLVGKARVRSGVARSRRQQYMDDAQKRASGQGWAKASAGEILGLYCHLHRIVYGVWPEELNVAKAWRQAMMQIGTFVKNNFEGDPEACVAFVEWMWRREEQRDKWRIAKGEERRRMMWRWCFNRSALTDYTASGMRRKVG